MDNIRVNEGKECVRTIDGVSYERYAIQTHVVGKEDNIIDVVKKYAVPHMQPGDILFMSEKAVACTQNRAIPLDEIKPGLLARFLVKFVYRSPHGLGRTMPETMEVTIQQIGAVCCYLLRDWQAVQKKRYLLCHLRAKSTSHRRALPRRSATNGPLCNLRAGRPDEGL